MAYQPKSFRKFLAASVSTALVATMAAPIAPSVAAATPAFPDVAEGHWAADAIAYLVEKGAIEGRPDGKFDPNGNLTRGEAAKILAVALDLNIDNNAKASFKDSENHWASKYIAAIEAQTTDVIDGYDANTFSPNRTITREEMAKMVVKAYDLKLNENAKLNFTDVSGWATEYVNTLASLGVVEGVSANTFSPKGVVNRAQTTLFVHRAEVKEVRKEVPQISVDLSAKALTTKEVEINFTAAVNSLTRNQIAVTDSKGESVFVSSVKLAEDGKSANVSFFQSLTDEETYTFNITVGKETLTYELEYVQGEISKIEVTNVKIANTAAPYQLKYKVLTDTGVDVTAETDIELRTDNAVINESTSKRGLISAGLNTAVSVFAEIVVGDVKSDRFTITTEEGEFASFSRFTVADSVADWENVENADLVDFVKLGSSDQVLQVSALDQFGTEYAVNADATFSSLTPNVLLVDTTTGALTPRAEGTATVRVTVGETSRTFTVKVVEAAKLASVEFARGDEKVSSLNLNNVISADENVDVQVKFLDQYGDAIELSNKEISFEKTGTAVNLASEKATVNGSSAILGLERNATGSSVVTVKDGNTVLGTINVTVQAPGTIAGYRLNGFGQLDINGANNEDTVATRTISLVGVDTNDVRVSNDLANAAWEVEDQDGNKVNVAASKNELTLNLGGSELAKSANTITLPNKPGTYTLRATVGNLVVEERAIVVVDTEAPYVISQTVGSIEITFGENVNLFDALADIFRVTQEGTTVAKEKIEEISFLSSTQSTVKNASGAAEEINAAVNGKGTATLYIETITVDGKEVDVDFQVRVTVK